MHPALAVRCREYREGSTLQCQKSYPSSGTCNNELRSSRLSSKWTHLLKRRMHYPIDGWKESIVTKVALIMGVL